MLSSTRSRATKGLIALIATSGLVLSGCTSDDPSPEPTDAKSTGAEAPDVDEGETPPSDEPSSDEDKPDDEDAAPPEALDIEDKTVQEAAEKYLDARENQASYKHKKPEDWLKQVKKYMTDEGFKELSDSTGDDKGTGGGSAWSVSHKQKIAVKVNVGKCKELTQAGTNSDTEKTISCSVSDIVVDKDGKNLPTTKIPSGWPYVGDQQTALLDMRKEGKGWKVHMDMTGMAN